MGYEVKITNDEPGTCRLSAISHEPSAKNLLMMSLVLLLAFLTNLQLTTIHNLYSATCIRRIKKPSVFS